jgi:hypothetical protein
MSKDMFAPVGGDDLFKMLDLAIEAENDFYFETFVESAMQECGATDELGMKNVMLMCFFMGIRDERRKALLKPEAEPTPHSTPEGREKLRTIAKPGDPDFK